MVVRRIRDQASVTVHPHVPSGGADMNHGTQPRRLLALSLALAALAPGAVLAQSATDRETQLEARVAELEKMVQQLVAQQQQTQQTVSEVKTAQTQIAQTPMADGKPKIQSAPILPGANPGTRFSYGGFVKLDAMVTDTDGGEIPDGSVGRMFYVPSAIPVGGASEGADTDMGAQFSRFWFAADTELDSGDKLRGYLEFDLFGGGSINGNEVATNTYGVSVRQAYVTWNEWLAGQAW
jgi:hypothetical protein